MSVVKSNFSYIALLNTYSRESEYSHKNLYINVHSFSIVITKNWKHLKCLPAGKWMVKQTVVHPHYVILLSSKKELLKQISWMDYYYYAEWKKKGLVSKGYTLYVLFIHCWTSKIVGEKD